MWKRIFRQVRASTLVRCACLGTLACLVIAYGFATTQSRIASDAFPIISETFMGTPQSYASEFLLGFAAWTLMLSVWAYKGYLDAYATCEDKWFTWSRKGLWFGVSSAILLGLTAAINYEESFGAHVTAAFGFLFAMWIWTAMCVRQLAAHPGSVSAKSLRGKYLACGFGFMGVVGFAALSALVGKENAYSLVGASEWLGVLSMIFACWTVSWDFDDKDVRLTLTLDSASVALPSVPNDV